MKEISVEVVITQDMIDAKKACVKIDYAFDIMDHACTVALQQVFPGFSFAAGVKGVVCGAVNEEQNVYIPYLNAQAVEFVRNCIFDKWELLRPFSFTLSTVLDMQELNHAFYEDSHSVTADVWDAISSDVNLIWD